MLETLLGKDVELDITNNEKESALVNFIYNNYPVYSY